MQQAELLRIYAEIEGMKAENNQRKALNESMAYTESDFIEKGNEANSIYSDIARNR